MAEEVAVVPEEKESASSLALKCIGLHWKGYFIIIWPMVVSLVFLLGTEVKFRCLFLVCLMAGYWVTECIPLQTTGLLPIVLLPMLGIRDTTAVCRNYFNQTNMVLMGSIMIATGIEHVGLHRRVAYGTILAIGCSPRRLHFGLTLVTTFLSMWLTNSAATAMMCPVILAILRELESEGIGSVFHPKLPTEAEDEKPKPTNITIAYFLSAAYASTVGGIGTLVGTGTNLTYKGVFETRFPDGMKIEFVPWMIFNVPPMLLMALVIWLSLQFVYMGLFRPNSEEAKIIKQGEIHKENAEKVMRNKLEEMGKMKWAEIAVLCVFLSCVFLWFFKRPEFIPGWGQLFEVVVSDATVSVYAVLMYAIIPATFSFCNFCTLNKADRPIKTTQALVPWKVLQDKMPWGLIFLLGGGFALADAGKSSGMAAYLGEKMAGMASLPPFAVLCLTNLFAIMATELTSNVAICNIVSPVFFEMAVAMEVHPLKFTYTVAMLCSFAFLLPVGTPPNAIIVDVANISTGSMIKGGLIIKIFSYAIYVCLFPTYGSLIFDFNTFPDWAKPGNKTN